ncbi:hypothetical protein DI272_24835 [Streptomyces sp. Act143]|uniref:DUF6086 family protein n=1 Tax=Streptomyces sp. Act143 TaxID=2200760 RepID=UPI000D679D62|nr:DUF6086 family protein [Streptomyces sp. Act143]PWI17029.1 hypothetical protein DI272_24835 [Streptomyces sp. Act143]
MSQYFDVGDETLWNPSNGAARLFLRHVRLYEEELGVPSGFGPMENDECKIDPAAFEPYVNALLDLHDRTRHSIIDALSEGFVATVLVLAERAGVEVRPSVTTDRLTGLTDIQVPLPDAQDRAVRLRERAGLLRRGMPR